MGALGAVPQPPPQPGPLPLMPATPGEAQAPAPRTPEIAMQAGLAALGRRDYAAAEAAAREILARGNSPRAYDAQFLLARALAGERNYQAAAVAFDDTYKRAQTGPHAPESLLGLANALISLNSNQAACGALERLRAEFPQARADLREEATALRRRAGCR
jgi:TolA-binding protein